MTLRRILAAVDPSEPARHAAERAMWLGSRCGAEVTLLHVYETIPDQGASLLSATNFEEHSRRTAEVDMRKLVGELDKPDVPVLIRPGRDVPGTICEVAEAEGADMIVVGTLGRTGVARFFLGSVAEQVVRRATCPVWVERRRTIHDLKIDHMVACTDLSQMSKVGLALAAELSAQLEARVEVVSAVEPRYHELSTEAHREATKTLTERVSEMAATVFGEETPRTTVAEGANVVDAITAHATQTSADVLVVGTHGRTGLRSVFMGSVAERLTRFAPCSVLVVRSPVAKDASSD